jgi:hypothetical protein
MSCSRICRSRCWSFFTSKRNSPRSRPSSFTVSTASYASKPGKPMSQTPSSPRFPAAFSPRRSRLSLGPSLRPRLCLSPSRSSPSSAVRLGRVAQSTGEAEFLALTPGCNMVVWVRTLLKELQLGYTRATAVYTDNKTARALSANTVKHSTMKQISQVLLGQGPKQSICDSHGQD